MSRQVITTEDEARADLANPPTQPPWLEARHSLPFHELSPDEFEVFCYLLLKREHPTHDIRYYGKSGDGGRDIIHRVPTPTGQVVRLIQCKRYKDSVDASDVQAELVKVAVNVHLGTIPETINELVFYVVPSLTTPAKNLINHQPLWRSKAEDALKKHLEKSKVTPTTPELKQFVNDWWPNPASEEELSLTERARGHPKLIEEFFRVRKVIDGSADDLVERISLQLRDAKDIILCSIKQEKQATQVLVQVPLDDLKSLFTAASRGLLKWRTTVAGDKWLDRPELAQLVATVNDTTPSASVVLGPPGSGKSALLARLGCTLVETGVVVLAIKADLLRNCVDTPAKLAEGLGLPILTDQAVLTVAATTRVVVLIDQLDALAALADLRSERLHVLLELIDRLAHRPNVHIVCSCRQFEYHYDGRLARIDAREVRLSPPAWEQICALLAHHQISAGMWPDDAKELLQIPQNLDIFLKRLSGPGEDLVFRSYQQLANDLWEKRVIAGGPPRAEFLFELADKLTELEELWIDRGQFENRWPIVQELIAVDILSLSEDGFRLGFRHQTLFEFTRAKAFARDGVSLADHVLVRQDALFVRPTLWMALNYLRKSSPGVYARELDKLSRNQALRRHIRHLLIDFLSQIEQPVPTDREQSLLVEALHDPAWRRKVLAAITGRPTWFELLGRTHLACEMRKSPREAWDVMWVLVSALTFAQERCMDLLEKHWLPDPTRHQHVWRVLDYVTDWDERTVGFAIRVVQETKVEQGAMWHLAQLMAKTKPVLAIRFVSIWLTATVRRIEDSDAVDSDRPEWDDRWAPVQLLIERAENWHGLNEMAIASPISFVDCLWPLVLRVGQHLCYSHSPSVIRYKTVSISFSRLDDREYDKDHPRDWFFFAMDTAIRSLAREKPEAFWDLVDRAGNPDSALLQRLMCRGAKETVAVTPNLALNFLREDSRRFWLGGDHDGLCDSVELVQSLAPNLCDPQLDILVSSIQRYHMYRKSNGSSDEEAGDNNLARGYRLELLAALPFERLSDQIKEFITSERATLPDYAQRPRSYLVTGLRRIGSPVSCLQMGSQTDEQMLELFAILPDSTQDTHPSDNMVGGSIQASQEFAGFAKLYPGRALALLPRFRPGIQERPVAEAIRALVDSGHHSGEIVATILALDAQGFTGHEFRETVAWSLCRIATSGLDDNICDMLERWRTCDWPLIQPETDRKPANTEPRRPSSVLWHPQDVGPYPQGRFPVLLALTRGFLCRKPHAGDLWLSMLEDQIERNDGLRTWQMFCLHLVDLRCCDRRRAAAFIARLIDRYPDVLTCVVGIRFMAHIAQLIPDDLRRSSYEIIRDWENEFGQQPFGELVGLWHLLHPDDDWAREQVDSALGASAGQQELPLLIGIAFAAANLWHEPVCREQATQILARLIPVSDPRVAFALMTCFSRQHDILVDSHAVFILRLIADNQLILLRSGVDDYFFDHLLDVFTIEPELVCRICEAAVQLRSEEIATPFTPGFSMARSAILDIAIRLQRSGRTLRGRGLNLFEALLDLGVSEAIAISRNHDLRLVEGHPMRPARRRNRFPRAELS